MNDVVNTAAVLHDEPAQPLTLHASGDSDDHALENGLFGGSRLRVQALFGFYGTTPLWLCVTGALALALSGRHGGHRLVATCFLGTLI